MLETRHIRGYLFGTLAMVGYEQSVVLLFYGKLMLPELIYYLVDIPFFYLCAFVLFPTIGHKSNGWIKPILYSLIFIAGFTVLETTAAAIIQYWNQAEFKIPSRVGFYKKMLLRCFYVAGLSFAYYLASRCIRRAKVARERELQLMKQERNQAELESAFLRSQINPHLLFNSLQFIEHQVEVGSPKALQAVRLLGEVMQYSLSATSGRNTIPLEDEINHIKQYVQLLRLRQDNRQYFELDIDAQAAATELQLPPGILVNFVENVFKHGDLSEEGDPAKIQLAVYNRHLTMHLHNLKMPETTYRRTGIGMNNIRRRLDLLYPGAYVLRSTEQNNHYHLYFEIEL